MRTIDAAAPRARTFYRLVLTNPPTLADFRSDLAQGRPPPSQNPEAVRLVSGLSMYATLTQARNKATAYPRLGRYIGALDLPIGGPIRYERTLPGSRGHHTIWGDPAELLACVTAVVPVESAE